MTAPSLLSEVRAAHYGREAGDAADTKLCVRFTEIWPLSRCIKKRTFLKFSCGFFIALLFSNFITFLNIAFYA